MAAARKAGFALLGAILGAVLGGFVGFGAGFAYVELANVTDFEGASGYAVVFWSLLGVVVGLVTGIIVGVRRG
ncbi:hypothetical protein CSC94_02035 [Zhengella mangrovi]|uniref:Major facilitator superfamily (MFS) profile domain-containing protein n=1 Tax=Zhengella mangrovi TaxID=1982044 RepID=A0A2G1QTC1_9HYPH|nr:hypothetical protein [Zhengella mangrovi]PHP68796.1 hypothetical protein CSC94_02035 [Zhengella mangrovi]